MPRILQPAEASPEMRAATVAPLDALNRELGITWQPRPLILTVQEAEEILGGLIGHYHWEWWYIEIPAVASHGAATAGAGNCC